MDNKSKIDIFSGMMMLILVLLADAADAVAIALAATIIGIPALVVSWFFGFTISTIILFWLYNINVSIKWFLPGSGLELIPGINGLPARTVALIATFAEDRLPAPVKKLAGKATKAITPIKK